MKAFSISQLLIWINKKWLIVPCGTSSSIERHKNSYLMKYPQKPMPLSYLHLNLFNIRNVSFEGFSSKKRRVYVFMTFESWLPVVIIWISYHNSNTEHFLLLTSTGQCVYLFLKPHKKVEFTGSRFWLRTALIFFKKAI